MQGAIQVLWFTFTLVQFNILLDRVQVILEMVFPANHLTNTGKTEPNYNEV